MVGERGEHSRLVKKQIDEGAPFVNREETMKWRDALDLVHAEIFDHEKFLQLARQCRHPDAQWFAALFPDGVAVRRERMLEELLKLGKDPRAMYVAWKVAGDFDLRFAVLRAGASPSVFLLLRQGVRAGCCSGRER
jgi:hypothetical protein